MGELNSRAGADVAQDKAARAAPREPRAQWLCADDEVSAAATSAFEAVDDDDEERSGDRADFEEMAFELDSLPCSTEIEMDCLHSEGGKEDLTDEAEHVDDSDDDEDDVEDYVEDRPGTRTWWTTMTAMTSTRTVRVQD